MAGAVVLGGLTNAFACGISENTECGFVWQAALPAAVIGAIIGAGIGSAF